MSYFTFDEEVAKKYGVEGAVILDKIAGWLKYNKANNINFHDGRTWTFNSVEAWSEQLPFWTKDQIRRYLEKLRESGALITGVFNKTPYDRTMWYTLSDNIEKSNPTSPKRRKRQVREGDDAQPIPISNQSANQSANQSISASDPDGSVVGEITPANPEGDLYKEILSAFTSQNKEFNFPKEGPAIKRLVKSAFLRECPTEFMKTAINTYWGLIHSPNEKLFFHQPFLPSVMGSGGLWPRLTERIEREEKECAQTEQLTAALKGFFR